MRVYPSESVTLIWGEAERRSTESVFDAGECCWISPTASGARSPLLRWEGIRSGEEVMAADKAGPDVGGECGKAMVGPSLRVPLPGGGGAPAIAAAAKFLWAMAACTAATTWPGRPPPAAAAATMAWGSTCVVHSTSFRSSSMSRFNFARLFWNHVMTCKKNKTGLAVLAFKRARALKYEPFMSNQRFKKGTFSRKIRFYFLFFLHTFF